MIFKLASPIETTWDNLPDLLEHSVKDMVPPLWDTIVQNGWENRVKIHDVSMAPSVQFYTLPHPTISAAFMMQTKSVYIKRVVSIKVDGVTENDPAAIHFLLTYCT